MTPAKTILYVDDEALSLKYFERLVGPMAPVMTASSVQEGRAVLQAHSAEIAVLLCDQRMPGEVGNALLQYARESHPHVVRMLTTAYSELGEAIEAINTGEIYRYITKPWELDSLRADLRNALELAALRAERDSLLGQKLFVQHSQLMGSRLSALHTVCALLQTEGHEQALAQFAQGAIAAQSAEPGVDWQRWDHHELLQAEARRNIQIATGLRHWLSAWAASPPPMAALAQALSGEPEGEQALHIAPSHRLDSLLCAPAGEPVTTEQCAWLAWLLWQQGMGEAQASGSGWRVQRLAQVQPVHPNWLAEAIAQLTSAA